MVKILNCYLYAKKSYGTLSKGAIFLAISVYSHLQYCISTWEVASAGVLDPLYELQKRIIRIITKSPYKPHTTPLFKKLNKLKINDICKLEIAKKCFA